MGIRNCRIVRDACVQMSTQRKNGEVVRKEKTLATAIDNNLTSRTNERIASVKRHALGAVRDRIRAIPFAQEVAPVSAICKKASCFPTKPTTEKSCLT